MPRPYMLGCVSVTTEMPRRRANEGAQSRDPPCAWLAELDKVTRDLQCDVGQGEAVEYHPAGVLGDGVDEGKTSPL